VTATTTPQPAAPAREGGPTPRSLRLAAGLLAIAAIVFALLTTRHGPDLGPDSVTYLSAADNLVHGRGFSDFTGEPLTVFAPAYPAILSIGHFIGVAGETVGRVTNALVVGAIALVSFVLLRRHVSSPAVIVGGTALAAYSSELLRIASYVATDPLFVLLTLVFILLMENIRAKPERRTLWIVLAGLVASGAFLVRYAAVPLFVTGLIVVVAYSAKDGRGAVARRTLLFAAISSIAPVLWLLRNATSEASDVLGVRVRSGDSPLTLARLLGETSKDLVFSYRVPSGVAAAAVVVGLGIAGSLAWRSRQQLTPRLSGTVGAMLPTIGLVVVGTPFVVIAHKVTGSDLDTRMLLPVWLPTIILGAWVLDNLLTAGRETGHEGLVRLLGVLMAAFVGASIVLYFQQVAKGTSNPFHYSDANVAELRTAIDDLPASAQVLSNDPWRIHIATGRQPVFLAPMRLRPSFSHRPISVRDVTDALCTRQAFLLWFDDSPATHRDTVEETLRGRGRLELSNPRRVDGGRLYTVRRGGEAPPCT